MSLASASAAILVVSFVMHLLFTSLDTSGNRGNPFYLVWVIAYVLVLGACIGVSVSQGYVNAVRHQAWWTAGAAIAAVYAWGSGAIFAAGLSLDANLPQYQGGDLFDGNGPTPYR